MSLLDMDERILQVVELADLRATPITDLKEPDASGVDVGILTGAVNTSTNEEVAHRMRERCQTLVALGDCAVFGGVLAMRNFFKLEDALRRAYVETESTDSGGKIPSDPELGRPTPVRARAMATAEPRTAPGCALYVASRRRESTTSVAAATGNSVSWKRSTST